MVAPHHKKFRVTQIQSPTHDGLDLVGVSGKYIYSTIDGTVVRAGWENPNDHSQGFGQRIVIRKTGTNDYYYFGHLADIRVSVGATVTVDQRIGLEGSTGQSTGSHLHYCARRDDDRNKPLWIPSISGIPNEVGLYNADNPPEPENWPGIFLVTILGGKHE